MSHADDIAAITSWNRANPVEAPVTYWRGVKEGPGAKGTTFSNAFLLGGHTPVVLVGGQGAIALGHVEPREPEPAPPAAPAAEITAQEIRAAHHHLPPQLTDRQVLAWPDVIDELERHDVEVSSYGWTFALAPETRPGRGHAIDAFYINSDHAICVRMDVYGYPDVSVGETRWIHNSADEECGCGPCETDRAEAA